MTFVSMNPYDFAMRKGIPKRRKYYDCNQQDALHVDNV